jgi:hypothetical protein
MEARVGHGRDTSVAVCCQFHGEGAPAQAEAAALG